MTDTFVNCSADVTLQAIDKSASISRIIYILSYYSKWLNQRINKNDLLSYLTTKQQINTETNQSESIYAWMKNLSATYTLSKLLDDFHYILSFHSSIDNDNFEILSKYIRDQMLANNKNDPNMNMNESIQFIRSQHKQSLQKNARTAIYCGYAESGDVCCQQILDSIHNLMLFTFKVGYRLTTQQKSTLEDIEYDENVLVDKRFKFIKDTICKQEEKEMEETKYDDHLHVFDGGIKFYYWNKAKHDNQWFVNPKYDTLKDEITAYISIHEWNDIRFKSECILQTNVVKLMTSSSYFAQEYEIAYRSPISAKHIVSLMLYTNFREIRNRFNDTFYVKIKDETAQSIINRHSAFCFLARLLRESVELFGLQSDDCDAPSLYYFGLNKICVFPSTIPHIYAPLLTSATMNTALLSKKGQICALRPYEQYLRYFDCQWLADDIGRNEKLFIGGHAPLVICGIYDIRSCLNYSTHMIALDYLCHMIKATPYLCDDEQDINDSTIRTITDLMSIKKNTAIPPYIKALFECNRKSVKTIDIDMDLMMTQHVEEDTFGYKGLQHIFVNKDGIKSPNVQQYIEVFPSVEVISVTNGIELSEDLFVVIFDFYSKNKGKTTLNTINIHNPNKNIFKFQDCLKTFDSVKVKYKDVNLRCNFILETNIVTITRSTSD